MLVRTTLIISILVGSQVLLSCQSQPRPATVGLHEAALTGNLEAVRQHVDSGTDLDARDDFGSTPLIVAATFGKADVAKALIDAGADLQIGNNDGSTPLHIASFLCYPEIVESLLEHGADPTATNNNGNTPLQGVAGPFEDVRGVYDAIGGALTPLGLRLDYDRIKATRPAIVDMLRSAEGGPSAADQEPESDSAAQG